MTTFCEICGAEVETASEEPVVLCDECAEAAEAEFEAMLALGKFAPEPQYAGVDDLPFVDWGGEEEPF